MYIPKERNFLLRQIIQLQELLVLAEGNRFATLSVQNRLDKFQRKLNELPNESNELIPLTTEVSDKTSD